jgi:hypothetical protein
MEPKTPLNSTTGLAILTMSVIVLILGAASAFSIQEFAVPALDDESIELGVVDDMTSDTTALPYAEETEDDGLLGEIRALLGSTMKERHAAREAAFLDHASTRLSHLENMSVVLQRCLDDANCTADETVLTDVLNRTVERMDHLSEVIANGTVLAKKDHVHTHGENHIHDANHTAMMAFRHHDADHDDDHDHDDDDHDDDGYEGLNASEIEALKAEYEALRAAKVSEHMDRLNATKTAIEFCLADAECTVNETMLTAVMAKIDERLANWETCLADGSCDSHEKMHDKGEDGDDDRKGSPLHKARRGKHHR